jgi:hypothetical protein
MLGLAAMAPATIIIGLSIKLTGRYRPQIWVAWTLQVIGSALMTTVKSDTSSGVSVGFCVIYGVGAG